MNDELYWMQNGLSLAGRQYIPCAVPQPGDLLVWDQGREIWDGGPHDHLDTARIYRKMTVPRSGGLEFD